MVLFSERQVSVKSPVADRIFEKAALGSAIVGTWELGSQALKVCVSP